MKPNLEDVPKDVKPTKNAAIAPLLLSDPFLKPCIARVNASIDAINSFGIQNSRIPGIATWYPLLKNIEIEVVVFRWFLCHSGSGITVERMPPPVLQNMSSNNY